MNLHQRLTLIASHPTVMLTWFDPLARYQFARYMVMLEAESVEPLSMLDTLDKFARGYRIGEVFIEEVML